MSIFDEKTAHATFTVPLIYVSQIMVQSYQNITLHPLKASHNTTHRSCLNPFISPYRVAIFMNAVATIVFYNTR